jgi:hemerythrin
MDRPLVWSETFAVGHEAIDDEHCRLIALINDLCASVAIRDAKEIARRLRVLIAESKRHTEHETVVLREFWRDLKDPANRHLPNPLKTSMAAAIEDHIADHFAFRNSLAEVTRNFRSGRWAEGTSLCPAVKHWFLDHAVKYDVQIKTIIPLAAPRSSRS